MTVKESMRLNPQTISAGTGLAIFGTLLPMISKVMSTMGWTNNILIDQILLLACLTSLLYLMRRPARTPAPITDETDRLTKAIKTIHLLRRKIPKDETKNPAWKSESRAGLKAIIRVDLAKDYDNVCLLYTSPSPRDKRQSRMPSSA